jgi:hypothetical protein
LEVLKRALSQTRRGLALKPFAEKYNWKWRNLYRDIEVLESAGFPIHKENGLRREQAAAPLKRSSATLGSTATLCSPPRTSSGPIEACR